MKWPKQITLTVRPKGEPDDGKEFIISFRGKSEISKCA